MITWKPIDPRYGGGESCFGINFREEFPEIAGQLSDVNGQYVHDKTCSTASYTYRAKVVQNGKYVFVERRKIEQENNNQQPASSPQKQADVITRIEYESLIVDLVKGVIDSANKTCKSFQLDLSIRETPK